MFKMCEFFGVGNKLFVVIIGYSEPQIKVFRHLGYNSKCMNFTALENNMSNIMAFILF